MAPSKCLFTVWQEAEVLILDADVYIAESSESKDINLRCKKASN